MSNSPTRSVDRVAWLTAIGIAILVFALSYRPRGFVVDNLVVPDGVEYAAGAQRLATLGRFDVPIGDATFPSRYPPSFAALLVPAYWLRADDFVAGIWACRTLWSLGCAALSFVIARRLGAAAACLVIVAINAHPLVVAHATVLLSDVPGLASMATLLAIHPSRGRRRFAWAGLALAVGVACRSLSFGFAVPFLFAARREPRPGRAAAALLVPALAIAAGNAIYNRVRFGSFAMNGYLFWCSFPYARFDLVFHPRFSVPNASMLWDDPWIRWPALAAVVGSAAAIAWQRRLWRDLLAPAWLAAATGTAAHLFYFFSSERFFLPLVLAIVLAAIVPLAAFASRWGRGRLAMGTAAAVVATFTLRSAIAEARGPFPRYDAMAAMARRLPDRCRLLTMYDPVTIEAFVTRGTRREWLAATRTQEYADKVVSDRPLDVSGVSRVRPSFAFERFIEQGGRLAVPETGDDDALLDRLADPAAPPLFVDRDTIELTPTLRARLARRFAARPLADAPSIVEYVPRATTRAVTR